MLQFICIISQIFYMKEACGYAKERIEKNGQVSEVSKQWVLWCPPRKKEKIKHVFLHLFPSSRERENFKEHSRIRISHHKYPPHFVHLHILIWLYDSTLFESIIWLYNICLPVCFHIRMPFLWTPHKL
jgi:hypothetical protein